jgi:hypothetical protein
MSGKQEWTMEQTEVSPAFLVLQLMDLSISVFDRLSQRHLRKIDRAYASWCNISMTDASYISLLMLASAMSFTLCAWPCPRREAGDPSKLR